MEQLMEQLKEINRKEPHAMQAISLVVNHIHGTYGDKYEKSENNPVITKHMLYNLEKGGYLNIYQSLKYHQRYISEGEKKSYMVGDLFKAIHYLVFEITRRIKKGDADIKEFKY